MKVNAVAAPLQHCTAKVVIQQDSGKTLPVLKGMDVPAQKAFHTLIEKELEVECPRVGEGDHKTGQPASSTANGNFSKMRPVHLTLFTGKSAQPKKGFFLDRTQACYESAQLHDTAAITAISDHLVNPGCAQAWVFGKNLPNEVGIRIGRTMPECLAVIEPIGFNGTADCLRVKTKFAGNGSDFPVLGIEQAANLGARLHIHHGNHLRG